MGSDARSCTHMVLQGTAECASINHRAWYTLNSRSAYLSLQLKYGLVNDIVSISISLEKCID